MGGGGLASCECVYDEFSSGFSGDRRGVEAQRRGGVGIVWETACKAGGGWDGGRVRVYAQSARPAAADPQSFPHPTAPTHPWLGGARYPCSRLALSRHLLTTLGDTQGRRWCCCRWCCRRYCWCHTPDPRFLVSGGDPYAYPRHRHRRLRAHTRTHVQVSSSIPLVTRTSARRAPLSSLKFTSDTPSISATVTISER